MIAAPILSRSPNLRQRFQNKSLVLIPTVAAPRCHSSIHAATDFSFSRVLCSRVVISKTILKTTGTNSMENTVEDNQATGNYGTQASVELTARSREEDQRQHASDTGERAH